MTNKRKPMPVHNGSTHHRSVRKVAASPLLYPPVRVDVGMGDPPRTRAVELLQKGGPRPGLSPGPPASVRCIILILSWHLRLIQLISGGRRGVKRADNI